MAARVAALSMRPDRLRRGLAVLGRALWLSEALVWLVRGLAAGLAAAALSLLLARFLTMPTATPWALVGAALLAALGVAATRPRSLARTALLTDRRLGL